jgi:DNA-binding transcriptional LysR family regulator
VSPAEELRVAQPAVSRSIARLEAELGVELFERRGRRVQLNRFGRLFLSRVHRVLGELDQARQELRDAAGLAGGTVAVATETLRMVTDVAAGFLAGHPGVRLRLFQSPAPVMSAQLHAGEVDLCLASQPLAEPGLRENRLLGEEVLLGVPPGHRLAGRTRVKVGDLAGEPFVTTRPGYWQRALADRLPAVARQAAQHPPVAWLRLDAPGCRRTLSLVWRQDAYLSAADRAFTTFAAAHAWPSDS